MLRCGLSLLKKVSTEHMSLDHPAPLMQTIDASTLLKVARVICTSFCMFMQCQDPMVMRFEFQSCIATTLDLCGSVH